MQSSPVGPPAQGGLRERQRLETLVTIHHAAVGLAREHGLHATTVEAIAARAGISRRTFFNYYPTKEDAVLGTTAATASEQALNEYFDDDTDDPFTRTVRLLVSVLRSCWHAGPDHTERLALMKEFPSLRERYLHHVAAAEDLIGQILDARAAEPTRSPSTSRALLMLAGTVLRFARSQESEAPDPDSDAAIESAIAVFRTALQEIS